MATGEAVVQLIEIMPPATLSATPDVRASGSTPAASIDVWDFDASTQEYLDFKAYLKGYDGGGLTFTLPWMASSATSGAVGWGIAIRAIPDDAEDLDASHSYAFNYVSDTCASASGELSYPTIAFTDGADMDSWADGEMAIIRVTRDATGASVTDDMAGDAELIAILGAET